MSLSRNARFTEVLIWPPKFVPKSDMTVINSWTEAWNDTTLRLRQWPQAVQGLYNYPRPCVATIPPINKLAARWIDYRGYPQGSQGWHDQRFDYIISGSRVGTILGHNQYQTQEYLFEQMIGAMPPDLVNHHMIRGTQFEPVAMRHCEREMGWVLLDMPLTHHQNREKYPILVVSLDRLFAGQADGLGQDILRIVECKCPYKIKEENLVLYNDQMQLQMEVITSHIQDEDLRNKCECFLYQFRHRSWSGTGMDEYRMDRVPRDPQWLNKSYPTLLDFDQRVRFRRQQTGITRDVFNKLAADSLTVYHKTMMELATKGGIDDYDMIKIARHVQEESHNAAYRLHCCAA